MDFDFDNLMLGLKAQIDRLYQANISGKDLVVGLGSTASGKSTMFTSLIYGSDSLNEIKIESEFNQGKGDTKTKKQNVIDLKNEFELPPGGKLFHIGHSGA